MVNNDLVPELTKSEFESFTKEGLVLIDFFAEWCMPCLTMSPIIDELSEKFKGKVKFGKVNVEENQEAAQKYSVMSIPNFVLLKDGEVVEQMMGSLPAEELEDALNKHL
ncbi:MAG: thioredoxin [Candidatus Pacearchaeota archaeon]|nr:thioredoxin [Candidatus Pacearchaeota archaeon]